MNFGENIKIEESFAPLSLGQKLNLGQDTGICNDCGDWKNTRIFGGNNGNVESRESVDVITSPLDIEKKLKAIENAKIQTAPSQSTSSQEKQSTETAEDKFYEKLGIKYNPTWNSSRNKGRILILLIAIGGFLAYKKFKK